MELKSKAQSTIRITLIIWLVFIILVASSISLFTVKYKHYHEGQQFAINAAKADGINVVTDENSYRENCRALYSYFTAKYYDVTINGQKFDNSEVRELMNKLKDAFAGELRESGYSMFDAYDIEGWFEYTNAVSYFFGKFVIHPLFLLFYISLIVTIFWTSKIKRRKRKSVTVTKDAIIYKNGKSSTQRIPLSDITSAEESDGKLKIKGSGLNISLSHLANAKEIKDAILHGLTKEVPEDTQPTKEQD